MVRVAGPGPEESDLGCDIERYRGMVLYRLWVGPAQADGFWMLYSRLMKTGGRLVRGSILSAHSPAAVEMPSGRLCQDEAGDDLIEESTSVRVALLSAIHGTLGPQVPARPDPTAASGRGGLGRGP